MTRTVLVPSSLARESRDKREATRKLGYVARAATIFRADRLVVYPDRSGERRWGGGFVRTVLAYAATPPYLRKEAWERRDELEYVGVLPPLRAVAQTGSGSDDSGSLRQGIVTEVGSDGRVRVNCGLQHPVSLPVPPEMAVEEGERVTIRVSSRRPLRARIVDVPPPGLAVEESELDTTLSRPDAGVRIAASRHGEELTVARLGELAPRVRDGFTVAFGAPERGLPEILGVDPPRIDPRDDTDAVTDGDSRSHTEPDAQTRFDLWLNTVPNQGSDVVRTEEAMFATLACLNLE
ncbi:RNA methyltransferase [Halomarina halobia]|uniref:RNA methyltransferase n=1 Tax=Halomarina halobia TaxID=3033386 RepID=A0ABD6A6E2_9EURY|nr:RNA methyltransferase [Halomarina sp. PSR21]